jgi:hypothetical protein
MIDEAVFLRRAVGEAIGPPWLRATYERRAIQAAVDAALPDYPKAFTDLNATVGEERLFLEINCTPHPKMVDPPVSDHVCIRAAISI